MALRRRRFPTIKYIGSDGDRVKETSPKTALEVVFVNQGIVFAGNITESMLRVREAFLREMFASDPDLDITPASTLEDLVNEHHSVILWGSKNAGKSTTLQMFSWLTKSPFVYIDGHYQFTDSNRIKLALRWASKHGALVLWDAFDYLLLGSAKMRKMTKDKHWKYTLEKLLAIQTFMEEGGVFVGTQHDYIWLERYANPFLLEFYQRLIYPQITFLELPLS